MKPKLLIILLAIFGLINSSQIYAQQYNQELIDSLIKNSTQAQVARASKFLLSGFTTFTGKFSKNQSTFSDVGFTPILLWKPHERILVEAEMETAIMGSETSIELGYADASFFVNKYLTIRAGKFLAPYGIYQDRLHPSWINKLPTTPLAFGEDELAFGPVSEVGFDFRGGTPIGSSKINYSFFVSNNAALMTDPAMPSKQGTLSYGNVDVQSKKLSHGGRVGLLPIENSSLEIGFSYRNGNVGDTSFNYKSVKAAMYAVDFSYINPIEAIKGTLDIKAQWNKAKIDKASYVDPGDPTGLTWYTFDNKRTSFFSQAAYRPSMSQSKLLKKTELVFRYAGFNPPAGAKDLMEIRQYTYGINYWFNWRTAFKAAYQSEKTNNAFFIQVAVGF